MQWRGDVMKDAEVLKGGGGDGGAHKVPNGHRERNITA